MLTAPPVRILRVITRLNIGGPAIHAILLTQALNDGTTFQSTLVTGTTAPHEGDMGDLAAARAVQPLVLPELGREVNIADDVLALVRMVRLVRQARPDVVHTHMAKAGTVGRIAARLAGVPLIVHTYHGHVFHGYFSPRKTQVFLTIERALARVTDRIVVVGERQRQEIAGYRVGSPEKLVPIPLGLELEHFLDGEGYRGQLRAELGLAPDAQVVGIVARLVPIKAHEDFFQAALAIREALPNTQFLVIGDGERRAELESLVARQGLQDHVHFLGWRQDLPRVYADLDVVALSSHNEGSPVALIEALASARPVVSTGVGGVGEVVLDGRTGLVVPPAEPSAFAEAVVRLLRDRDLASRLGRQGRGHVYPRYASTRLVRDIRDLYLRELAAKGRPLPPVTPPANGRVAPTSRSGARSL